MYLLTDGQWWIDRVTVTSTELQRARLGGVSEWRGATYPGHVVSWKFREPANGLDVAILIPKAKLDEFTVLAYNLRREQVGASMIAWDITPGTWEASIARDTNGDDIPDTAPVKRTVALERTGSMDLVFEPGVATVVQMKLVSRTTPYWERPDLGIGDADVKVSGGTVNVIVHSLGSVDVPQADIALVDAGGRTLATARVPALKAPVDLLPKTVQVALAVPSGADLSMCRVVLDPERKLTEITRRNNEVPVAVR
jgi:hypothetical protein